MHWVVLSDIIAGILEHDIEVTDTWKKWINEAAEELGLHLIVLFAN